MAASPELKQEKTSILKLAAALKSTGIPRQPWTLEDFKRKIASTSSDLLEDPELALASVSVSGRLLEYFPEIVRDDPRIATAAVRQAGDALRFVSYRLRSDKAFVLRVLRREEGGLNSIEALKYVSKELLEDRDFARAIVSERGASLRYVSSFLQADKDIVLAAVKSSGRALCYASVELRGDRDIVLDAVQSDGLALENASDQLQADKDVVLEAVKSNGFVLRSASEELQADKEVVFAAVRSNGYALDIASKDLQADSDVTLAAVQQNGRALQYTSATLRGTREIVVEAIKNAARGAFQHASPELQSDKDIVLLTARCCRDGSEARGCFDQGRPFLDGCSAENNQGPGSRMTWETFLGAFESKLAAPGQQVPVVSVNIAHESDGERDGPFCCVATLLSGKSFPLEIPIISRPGPTVNDLAEQLSTELPRHVEVDGPTHLYVTFVSSNGDNFPVTPWDWDRPLSEFVCSSEHTEGA